MRRILSDQAATDLSNCPYCGSRNGPGARFCLVCGQAFDNKQALVPAQSTGPSSGPLPPASNSMIPPPPTSLVSSPVAGPSGHKRSLREYFGWRAIDGTVIYVGPSQLIKAPRRWWKLLLKLVVAVVAVAAFGALALIVIVSLFAFSLLLSWLFPRYERGRGGFLQSVASQFVGFFLTSRLLGQKPTVPACDYRLRDSSGSEYLVRVEGYVHTGGMNVGDDVVAEGYDRQGTLVMKQGWNKRLGTLIRVKEK